MLRRLLLPGLLLFFLVGCASGLYSVTLVFDGEQRIEATDKLPGDLFVRAGTAVLEHGAVVEGDVYVLGGQLRVDGVVDGDLVLLGGTLALGPQAVVAGDLRQGGGEMMRADTAVVRGDVVAGSGLMLPAPTGRDEAEWDDWLRTLATILLLAGVAAFLARGRPQSLTHIGDAIQVYPLVCIATGLLIILVLPALLVMMAFTVVLMPLVLVIGLFLLLVWAYGVIAAGQLLGNWITAQMHWSDNPAFVAFGGTLLLLLLFAIPTLGDGMLALSTVVILGAMLLTRLGSRPFVSEMTNQTPLAEDSYTRPPQQ